VKDAIVFLALLTCLLGPTIFKLAERKKELTDPSDKA
jgi:hypothetical protein